MPPLSFQPTIEKNADGETSVYQSITFQESYSKHLFEELRSDDYNAARKHGADNGLKSFTTTSSRNTKNLIPAEDLAEPKRSYTSADRQYPPNPFLPFEETPEPWWKNRPDPNNAFERFRLTEEQKAEYARNKHPKNCGCCPSPNPLEDSE